MRSYNHASGRVSTLHCVLDCSNSEKVMTMKKLLLFIVLLAAAKFMPIMHHMTKAEFEDQEEAEKAQVVREAPLKQACEAKPAGRDGPWRWENHKCEEICGYDCRGRLELSWDIQQLALPPEYRTH